MLSALTCKNFNIFATTGAPGQTQANPGNGGLRLVIMLRRISLSLDLLAALWGDYPDLRQQLAALGETPPALDNSWRRFGESPPGLDNSWRSLGETPPALDNSCRNLGE